METEARLQTRGVRIMICPHREEKYHFALQRHGKTCPPERHGEEMSIDRGRKMRKHACHRFSRLPGRGVPSEQRICFHGLIRQFHWLTAGRPNHDVGLSVAGPKNMVSGVVRLLIARPCSSCRAEDRALIVDTITG